MTIQYEKKSYSGHCQLKLFSWLLLIICMNTQVTHALSYTLQEAVELAQNQDPWLHGNVQQQISHDALSIEAGSLPDPVVSIGLINLPSDSFDFSEQNMTQLKVGLTQKFPRGDTRALTREKLQNISAMQPMMRANRQAQVAVFVAHLWLDAYRNHKSIDLIENDRNLFEYLVDVAQSSYTSATGQTRQQDLIRAQLELTRLDDRLTILKQQRDKNLADLGEWLEDFNVSLSANDANYTHVYSEVERHLLSHNGTYDANTLTEVLIIHPLIRSIDQKILASDSDIRIAKQSYKPQWGVNASYAYRDNTPEGEHRPDFLSLGVSFDVPLFTANRQDKRVQSAKAKFQSTKTERDLALRQLKAAYQSSVLNYHRLKERQALFDTRLLVEMYQQAEASLMAYTNDDGDFAEAVRAQIAQLNARIDALNIDIDIHKTLAQLNYFHADSREYSLLTHQPKH